MKPNLLYIGTYRAGSTWLHNVLKEHKDVFLSDEKELMFFSHHYGRGVAWYEKCFSAYGGEKYAGEISPSYLASEKAPELIRKHLPKVKIIVSLRNPVDQISSLYNLWLLRGYTIRDIFSVLHEEKELLNNVLYFKHLSHYMNFFDSKDILILFYDDLVDNPKNFLAKVYKFLQIEEFYPDTICNLYNRGRVPKSLIIEKGIARTGDFLRRTGLLQVKSLLNRLGISDTLKTLNTSQRVKKDMPSEIRSLINAHVSEDISNLAKLANRDLSSWS